MADLTLKITVNRPRETSFTVAGKTLAEAKKNLDRRDEWGLYDATRNFKSSAQVDGEGNIRSVTMTINPVIELPAWAGYRAATKAQKASWDTMLKALRAHELKHHEIQVACAEALKKTLKAAKGLDASTLNEIIEQQQQACQKKQDAYDGSSGHGAKEGVVLDLDA